MNNETVLFGLKETYDICVNNAKTNGIYANIEEMIDVSRASVLFDPESYVGCYRSFKMVRGIDSVEPDVVYGLVIAGNRFDIVVTMSVRGEVEIELHVQRRFNQLATMFQLEDIKDWLVRHIAVGMSLKAFVKAVDDLDEKSIKAMMTASKKAIVPLTRMLEKSFSNKQNMRSALEAVERQIRRP